MPQRVPAVFMAVHAWPHIAPTTLNQLRIPGAGGGLVQVPHDAG